MGGFFTVKFFSAAALVGHGKCGFLAIVAQTGFYLTSAL
jgi:hypothetical protein